MPKYLVTQMAYFQRKVIVIADTLSDADREAGWGDIYDVYKEWEYTDDGFENVDIEEIPEDIPEKED